MGISWSSNRRRYSSYPQHPPPLPPPPPPPPPTYVSAPYYYSPDPHPLPPPPENQLYPPTTVAAATTTTSLAAPYHPPAPPPPIHSYYHSGGFGSCSYGNPVMGRFQYHPYYASHPTGWLAVRPPVGTPQQAPPPYVDHLTAKKVRNDVNVHRDTLRLEVDRQNPDHHLISFVFDALYDGNITIFYFAKEELNCQFVPVFPEAFTPVRIPFQKGLGQKFHQPSGTGIDLGFFELDDLSKPSPGEDTYPLVISAETCMSPNSLDDNVGSVAPPIASPHMQITQAVLVKNNGDPFQVRVVRQILWIDGVRYELRELYGIGSSAAQGFDDNDPGKECVICMTEPKDTAVLPCRHMCMCSECAKELRLQSNRCPICRQSIEELIEIKINNGDQ